MKYIIFIIIIIRIENYVLLNTFEEGFLRSRDTILMP